MRAASMCSFVSVPPFTPSCTLSSRGGGLPGETTCNWIQPFAATKDPSPRSRILLRTVFAFLQFSTSSQQKIQTPINSVSMETSYVYLDTNNLNKIPVTIKNASCKFLPLEDSDPIKYVSKEIFRERRVHVNSGFGVFDQPRWRSDWTF